VSQKISLEQLSLLLYIITKKKNGAGTRAIPKKRSKKNTRADTACNMYPQFDVEVEKRNLERKKNTSQHSWPGMFD
jgi:hypothetical protein